MRILFRVQILGKSAKITMETAKNKISGKAKIKELIGQDLVAAMRAKDKIKSLVLRTLNAAIKNAEIAKRSKLSRSNEAVQDLAQASALNDDEIIGVIGSQIKQRRDSIAEFEKGNRGDLVEKEKAEMQILMAYMPVQMGEEEIKKIAADAIGKTGAGSVKEMGKVMALVMGRTKGKADGAAVSRIVKELLTK